MTRVRSVLWGVLMAATVGARAVAAQDRFTKPTRPPAPAPTATPPASPAATPTASNPKSAPSPAASNDPLVRFEREDFGVAPSAALRSGPMHAPTPTSIPGGQVVTTAGVRELQQRRVPHVLLDVLGGPPAIPGAIPAAWLSQPGTFTDDVQSQASQMLQQVTQGRRDMPLVFYCLSPHCWMSYNAALRAIKAGYTNVLWYRGGVEAWNKGSGR